MADRTITESSSTENQPSNPLSRKLNKILETRLDNDKVRTLYFVSAHLENKFMLRLKQLFDMSVGLKY